MNLSHLAVCLGVPRQKCDAVGTDIGAEGVPWSESDTKPKNGRLGPNPTEDEESGLVAGERGKKDGPEIALPYSAMVVCGACQGEKESLVAKILRSATNKDSPETWEGVTEREELTKTACCGGLTTLTMNAPCLTCAHLGRSGG